MKFKNKNHQALFENTAKKLDRRDKTKMAVLFLLTADGKLWNASKHHISRGKIYLNDIKLRNGTPKAYTLLCCAKDIAFGTSYLTVNDLADAELITPKLLGIINNAITIRRYGIKQKGE